jgi:DNA-binding transcriptional regulator YhcF (GntR family)
MTCVTVTVEPTSPDRGGPVPHRPAAPAGHAAPSDQALLVVTVDASGDVPPFEQVRRQVQEQAASGALPPGHRLPTVRALAEQLGLAVNTVARAYRELEQAGVVVTRGRSGTFVAVRGEDREREGLVAAREYLRRAGELGIAPEDAVRLVGEVVQSRA